MISWLTVDISSDGGSIIFLQSGMISTKGRTTENDKVMYSYLSHIVLLESPYTLYYQICYQAVSANRDIDVWGMNSSPISNPERVYSDAPHWTIGTTYHIHPNMCDAPHWTTGTTYHSHPNKYDAPHWITETTYHSHPNKCVHHTGSQKQHTIVILISVMHHTGPQAQHTIVILISVMHLTGPQAQHTIVILISVMHHTGPQEQHTTFILISVMHQNKTNMADVLHL